MISGPIAIHRGPGSSARPDWEVLWPWRQILVDELARVRPPAGLAERVFAAFDAMSRSTVADDLERPPGGGSDPAPSSRPPATITMEQLVHDHADAVYRVALSVTRDPMLAEDASQDALMKAWQSLPNYRGDSPLRHWVLRIAHNASISLLRKRRDETYSPADLPDQPSSEASVESQVQARLALDRFAAALDQLDGLSRSIIVLREVEGLSYDEMSDVLQLPLPTIRTRLLRARRQLADSLEGWQL